VMVSRLQLLHRCLVVASATIVKTIRSPLVFRRYSVPQQLRSTDELLGIADAKHGGWGRAPLD
jgi:hypothetical protein